MRWRDWKRWLCAFTWHTWDIVAVDLGSRLVRCTHCGLFRRERW